MSSAVQTKMQLKCDLCGGTEFNLLLVNELHPEMKFMLVSYVAYCANESCSTKLVLSTIMGPSVIK